jgi:hypothetical protein
VTGSARVRRGPTSQGRVALVSRRFGRSRRVFAPPPASRHPPHATHHPTPATRRATPPRESRGTLAKSQEVDRRFSKRPPRADRRSTGLTVSVSASGADGSGSARCSGWLARHPSSLRLMVHRPSVPWSNGADRGQEPPSARLSLAPVAAIGATRVSAPGTSASRDDPNGRRARGRGQQPGLETRRPGARRPGSPRPGRPHLVSSSSRGPHPDPLILNTSIFIPPVCKGRRAGSGPPRPTSGSRTGRGSSRGSAMTPRPTGFMVSRGPPADP